MLILLLRHHLLNLRLRFPDKKNAVEQCKLAPFNCDYFRSAISKNIRTGRLIGLLFPNG
jgi:hypothetical protein